MKEHRFRCEVRWCVKKGIEDRDALDRYLVLVKKARGALESLKLQQVAREQYRLGNRGEFGVWK